MASSPFDLVVIGAGPGGYVAAVRAGQLGLRTAVVERDKALGGTCLLRGCIPTKFLLQAALHKEQLSHLGAYGIEVTGVTHDWQKTLKEKTKTVRRLSSAIGGLMKKGKIEVIAGHARLDGPGKVAVALNDGGTTTLDTKHVLIATGSYPRMLPFLERDGKRIITSDEALVLPEIPRSMVVVGSGAVGSEFASIYNAFGTSVTLVEALPRLVPTEDADISAVIHKAFTKRGIAVRTNAKLESADVTPDGVSVKVTTDGTTETLDAEVLLVAVGRGPISKDLGLETTAIQPDKAGFIPVDEYMRTAQPSVYAIGDVVPTQGLAHLASKEGILAVEHLAGQTVRPIRYETCPNAIYCEPEVGSVGLTEEQARERGMDVKTGTFPFSHSSKAMIGGHQEGLVKIVADGAYDEVVGVHIVGHKATELIAGAVLGLSLETTAEEMGHAIHPHPTLSEALMEAAENLHGKSIHI